MITKGLKKIPLSVFQGTPVLHRSVVLREVASPFSVESRFEFRLTVHLYVSFSPPNGFCVHVVPELFH